jgi:CheY-like chemotaxis protein
MESIGTLAGGIAHDLNNVLAPIMMAVEVLLAKYGDDEGKRILETLATSAKRGSDIVKQILTFGRGVEGGRILVQPKHIVREIEKIVNETFPKSIQVKVVLQKNLWTILADPTQLHQVLLNLCVNARDGMPMGGILMVSAENVSLDEYFASMNTEAKAGPYVVVTIADSGTGIPPEIIDQIFDPFFTTKKIGEGTGLGLSTALGIVKGHGGFINVYSELGKGTSFKVYLPAQEKEQEALPGEERLEPPLGQGEMILVVDDEASIREIAKITLEANGYNVLTANDGVEAVSIYAQDNGRIKVVLMDMMMPGMDGFATIRALQIMKATARIVATSGGTARDGFDMALMPGVDAFLKKPYTAGKLLTALHEVLNKR